MKSLLKLINAQQQRELINPRAFVAGGMVIVLALLAHCAFAAQPAYDAGADCYHCSEAEIDARNAQHEALATACRTGDTTLSADACESERRYYQGRIGPVCATAVYIWNDPMTPLVRVSCIDASARVTGWAIMGASTAAPTRIVSESQWLSILAATRGAF